MQRSRVCAAAGQTRAYACDNLYFLERAGLFDVPAVSTGRPLRPVHARLASHVATHMQGEREQSDLLFEALRRSVPAPGTAS